MRYPEDAEPAYDAESDEETEPHEAESLLDALRIELQRCSICHLRTRPTCACAGYSKKA